jgi:hypothetical protein
MAGARDQVHYFRLAFAEAAATGRRQALVSSSFGDGEGSADSAFREGTLDFEARGVSMFAPFNRYRITQQYRYEDGELVETVELFKRRNGTDTAFMKFEERARMFAPVRFSHAPEVDASVSVGIQ